MAVLLDKNTRLIVQGLTGKIGMRACQVGSADSGHLPPISAASQLACAFDPNCQTPRPLVTAQLHQNRREKYEGEAGPAAMSSLAALQS